MEQPSSSFCQCCFRRKVAPVEQHNNQRTGVSNGLTEVGIDSAANIDNHHLPTNEDDEDGASSVHNIFRNVFHVSVDSKLLLKLYGSKDILLLEKKRQDKGCRKWMVHPYSHFR